jgi:uncharacterized Tic20 family protein
VTPETLQSMAGVVILFGYVLGPSIVAWLMRRFR